ncbi:MAG: tyrosine-type recombinase/integrase [Desulfobacteraceae bacterium]|nr:tyrosine-type recombinase/integrase [Desulfobacteraceae bacterium]
MKNQEKKQQKGMDLMTFCTRYLDYANRFTEKVYKEKKALCRRILNTWGPDKPVCEIDSGMIQLYLDHHAKIRSANASNKDRKNLLAQWCYGQKFLKFPHNPVAVTYKRAHDPKLQYTPWTKDILKLLACTTRKESVLIVAYLQTAARKSEIFRWTWLDDINFDKKEYRLGTRKTKDGSMEYEYFPMSDDLYDSLSWWWENRTIKDSPYVFPNEKKGRYYGKPHVDHRKFLKRLCERAQIKPFGYHALRRYVASVLADTHKVSSKAIQRILRHKKVSTTERYIGNINNDLKSTLNLLSNNIQLIDKIKKS